MRNTKTLPTTDDPVYLANGFYLTKAQVAHRWGVIHQTVQQWIDKGWLSSVQIPGLGHVINVQELEGFVPPKRGRKPARPRAESSSPTRPGRRASPSHKPRQIARTVSIRKLSETSHSDLAYWRALPPAQRVMAVEEIKQEFYGEAYTSQSRLARVFRIVRRGGR
jgi:hypothetical protein